MCKYFIYFNENVDVLIISINLKCGYVRSNINVNIKSYEQVTTLDHQTGIRKTNWLKYMH